MRTGAGTHAYRLQGGMRRRAGIYAWMESTGPQVAAEDPGMKCGEGSQSRCRNVRGLDLLPEIRSTGSELPAPRAEEPKSEGAQE